jgi:hypothetical protein
VRFHEVPWDPMRFYGIPWSSMRFYDVPVNQSVPTEANRGLTSYSIHSVYKSVEGFGLSSRMLEASLSAVYMRTAAFHFQKLEPFMSSLGI